MSTCFASCGVAGEEPLLVVGLRVCLSSYKFVSEVRGSTEGQNGWVGNGFLASVGGV